MEYTLGILVGCVVTTIVFIVKYRYVGTLRIDHSNQEKDIYRFELDSIDDLTAKHKLVLRVDNKADLSQE